MIENFSRLAAPIALRLASLTSEENPAIDAEIPTLMAYVEGIKEFARGDLGYVSDLLHWKRPVEDAVYSPESSSESDVYEPEIWLDIEEEPEAPEEVLARLKKNNPPIRIPDSRVQAMSASKSINQFSSELSESTALGVNYYGLRALCLRTLRSLPLGRSFNFSNFRGMVEKRAAELRLPPPSYSASHRAMDDLARTLHQWSGEKEGVEVYLGSKHNSSESGSRIYVRYYDFTPPVVEDVDFTADAGMVDLIN
jgi:hypothetical protein